MSAISAVRSAIVLLLVSALVMAQPCPYETLAGLPFTFAGDGVPAAQARMHNATFTLTAADGTVYFSDTGNHRVRRVTPAGIVETVAGTGQPGFGGDGGPGRQALLNGPMNLLLGPDGTLYISDTNNHRVRALRPDGTIVTVAGNGHHNFSGDGGPVVFASLNKPTSLALNSAGDLFVLDSLNRRVRRVAADGTISTVAGTAEVGHDRVWVCPVADCFPEGPATEAVLYEVRDISIGLDHRLYIAESRGIRRVEEDGTLSRVSLFDDSTMSVEVPERPTPIGAQELSSPSFVPAPGRDLVVIGYPYLLEFDTSSQMLTPLAFEWQTLGGRPSLSASGQTFTALGFSNELFQQTFGGERRTLIPADDLVDPVETGLATAGPLTDPLAVDVGPDGTIYIFTYPDTGARVLALKPNGELSVFAGGGAADLVEPAPATSARLGWPYDLAVDSQGAVYIAVGGPDAILRVRPDGLIENYLGRGAASDLPGYPFGIAIDGQDRLYVFIGTLDHERIVRLEGDGTFSTWEDDLQGRPFQAVGYAQSYGGLTVSPEGQIFSGSGSPNGFSIITARPGEPLRRAPMEIPLRAEAIAYAPDGRLYLAHRGTIWALDPDGTMLPVFGADAKGFWGEFGFDSAAEEFASIVTDMAVDSSGRVIAALEQREAIVRFHPSDCQSQLGPIAAAVVDSATFDPLIDLAAGQLVSIFGARLGPSAGISSTPDASGRLPTELGSVRVLFNGVPGPILFARQDQVNAIVPFGLSGLSPLAYGRVGGGEVIVDYRGNRSVPLKHSIVPFEPTIFSSFPGKWARCLNEDGSINSAEAPAKLGSIIVLFATGLGETNPPGDDGNLATELKRPMGGVRVLVDNHQEAEILYVGAAPTLVEGVMQINCRLPAELSSSILDRANIRIQMVSHTSPYRQPWESADTMIHITR